MKPVRITTDRRTIPIVVKETFTEHGGSYEAYVPVKAGQLVKLSKNERMLHNLPEWVVLLEK